VPAFPTTSRLVLGQEAVFEKSNKITAIPALIERLDLVGALVSMDAMGCQVAIAQSIPFREHLSRLRTGHGAKKMVVVRQFALNLVATSPILRLT
jgi:predicted transposase YbfD/YdcC